MAKNNMESLSDDFGIQIAAFAMESKRSLEWVPECDSSNTVAEGMATTGWRGCVLTDVQHRGRGRLQRRWDSEPGQNLLLSWVKDWHCPLNATPRLTLLLAAEIAHELDLWVKWPNDIMTRTGLKVGGILSTIHEVGTDKHTVIIGVGLNVNQVEFPPELKASSLRLIHGNEQSRLEILKRLLNAMDRIDPCLDLERWSERSITLGKRVEVAGRVGVATGIREDGALIVDGVPITSGDVSLVEM